MYIQKDYRERSRFCFADFALVTQTSLTPISSIEIQRQDASDAMKYSPWNTSLLTAQNMNTLDTPHTSA
nr:unnamed protein product [Callosobruchus chinensis]